jgi:hypothetical protein
MPLDGEDRDSFADEKLSLAVLVAKVRGWLGFRKFLG